MPRKHQYLIKAIQRNRDRLTLACEWQDCRDVFDKMQSFIQHVTTHLRTAMPAQPDTSAEDPLLLSVVDLNCKWRECVHEPFPGFMELIRHVYFHAFHLRIKSLGLSLILKNDLRGCMLDSCSRNTIPELPERLVCAWRHCSSVFDNPDQFYSHVNNHSSCFPCGNHVPNGCACEWDGCDVVVKSKHKLREHLRSHTQEKLFACPTCGGLFANSAKLYDHLSRQAEADVHSYQCSHCNKRYATVRLLKEHMRHHVNHYKCPFCDMTCPNPAALRTHLRYRHTEDRPYKCTDCDGSFKSDTDLRRHAETHGPCWMKCHECSYRSHNVWDLNSHLNRYHDISTEDPCTSPYVCHICAQQYCRGAKLTAHLKVVHKFKWPPGHCRFKYKLHEDRSFRLQTVRYESIELNEQFGEADKSRGGSNNNPSEAEGSRERVIQVAAVDGDGEEFEEVLDMAAEAEDEDSDPTPQQTTCDEPSHPVGKKRRGRKPRTAKGTKKSDKKTGKNNKRQKSVICKSELEENLEKAGDGGAGSVQHCEDSVGAVCLADSGQAANEQSAHQTHNTTMNLSYNLDLLGEVALQFPKQHGASSDVALQPSKQPATSRKSRKRKGSPCKRGRPKKVATQRNKVDDVYSQGHGLETNEGPQVIEEIVSLDHGSSKISGDTCETTTSYIVQRGPSQIVQSQVHSSMTLRGPLADDETTPVMQRPLCKKETTMVMLRQGSHNIMVTSEVPVKFTDVVEAEYCDTEGIPISGSVIENHELLSVQDLSHPRVQTIHMPPDLTGPEVGVAKYVILPGKPSEELAMGHTIKVPESTAPTEALQYGSTEVGRILDAEQAMQDEVQEAAHNLGIEIMST